MWDPGHGATAGASFCVCFQSGVRPDLDLVSVGPGLSRTRSQLDPVSDLVLVLSVVLELDPILDFGASLVLCFKSCFGLWTCSWTLTQILNWFWMWFGPCTWRWDCSLKPGVGHLDFKPVGLLVMDKYFPRVSNLIKQLPAQGHFGGFFPAASGADRRSWRWSSYKCVIVALSCPRLILWGVSESK